MDKLIKSESTFEPLITEDGSPSLYWVGGEAMHHRGGALAETEWIYGDPIRETLKQRSLRAESSNAPSSRFVSVGLGLGYNEFVMAREALSHQANIEILSFEKDENLRQSFLEFIHSASSGKAISSDSACAKVCAAMQLPSEVLQFLVKLYNEGRFQIRGTLDGESQSWFANGICYDAFSVKSTPELWQQDFLESFLRKFADPEYCLFSTYACTGNLKRALKASGFELLARAGFGGKRTRFWPS